jgi:hypothetical protein
VARCQQQPRQQQQPHQAVNAVHCFAYKPGMRSTRCRQGDPGESHLVLAMDDPGMPSFTLWQDMMCEWVLHWAGPCRAMQCFIVMCCAPPSLAPACGELWQLCGAN